MSAICLMYCFTSVKDKFRLCNELINSLVLCSKPSPYFIKVTGSLSIDFSGLWPVLCTKCFLGRKQMPGQKQQSVLLHIHCICFGKEHNLILKSKNL